MPFLRFSRDRRGYESTYLVHTFRRRGKSRSQILYWFRSPPNVKIGRAALDADTVRSIEECYPDLAFDWPKILLRKAPPSPPPDEDRGRRRRRSPTRSARPRGTTRVKQRPSEVTRPGHAGATTSEAPPAERVDEVAPVLPEASPPASTPTEPAAPAQVDAACGSGAEAERSTVPVRRRGRSRRGGVRRTQRRRQVAAQAASVSTARAEPGEPEAPEPSPNRADDSDVS